MFEGFFRKKESAGVSQPPRPEQPPVTQQPEKSLEPDLREQGVKFGRVMEFETLVVEDITVHELLTNDILIVSMEDGTKYEFLVQRDPQIGARLSCISDRTNLGGTSGRLFTPTIKLGKNLRYGEGDNVCETGIVKKIEIQRPKEK